MLYLSGGLLALAGGLLGLWLEKLNLKIFILIFNFIIIQKSDKRYRNGIYWILSAKLVCGNLGGRIPKCTDVSSIFTIR